jgi:hypothetical protein
MAATHECEHCKRILTDDELTRYAEEFGEWAKKHPGWETRLDAGDRFALYCASGVRMDCDHCAAERLMLQKQILANTTFIERVAEGGPEGFLLVALVLLGVLLLCFAR